MGGEKTGESLTTFSLSSFITVYAEANILLIHTHAGMRHARKSPFKDERLPFFVSSLSVFLNWFSCMPLLDPRVAFLHLLYSQESSLQLHPPLQRRFSKGKAPSDSTQQWNVIRLSQLMGITAAYTWRVEQVW